MFGNVELSQTRSGGGGLALRQGGDPKESDVRIVRQRDLRIAAADDLRGEGVGNCIGSIILHRYVMAGLVPAIRATMVP